MSDFKREFPDSFTLMDKINFLERSIIIASIAYYDLDYNIMSDYKYDGISKQLVELYKEKDYNVNEDMYHYCFYDFDGTTGFDLRDRLTPKDNDYLSNIAHHLKYNRNSVAKFNDTRTICYEEQREKEKESVSHREMEKIDLW